MKNWALVRIQGFDDYVLSLHSTKKSAEKEMKRYGKDPDDLISNGMDIVDLVKSNKEVVECFEKLMLRTKLY